ncbi:MAG TPA: MFS transporter [Candidatus Didemnitutus sp.]|jgi:FSR family fosmidomycin resistance protein-like MFS transporter
MSTVAQNRSGSDAKGTAVEAARTTVMSILWALALSHLLNDTIQSLLPAIYPVLKDSFRLNYTQVGLITLTFQITASILQPFVGLYTDRHPKPFSLATGMAISLVGLVLLSRAWSYPMILVSAATVGAGSAIFHPEASRVARMASGGKHGFAQSLFQVGGNFGSSLGPALAALVVVPFGQHSIAAFTVLAAAGIFVLARVGGWYRDHLVASRAAGKSTDAVSAPAFSTARVAFAIAILIILIFSKYFYLVSLSNYYTFYLIDRFHLSVPQSQFCLFGFLFAVAAGTIIGGPVGDRIGRKPVIWISILGVAPFSLVLPHVNLPLTIILAATAGLILASAFSAILVYAQELMPGRVGLVAGLFFGLAFGAGGIGSALLGQLADHTSINYVFKVCAYLPLIGLLTGFLPNMKKMERDG